jgi:hypothetical protein
MAKVAALMLLACSVACAAPLAGEDQVDLSAVDAFEGIEAVELMQTATAMANATTPAANATAPKAKEPKDKKASNMRQLKVNAYIKKIKEFQKIKKQRWDPADEQKLAGQLVDIDALMKTTDDERSMEAQLRTGPKKFSVELSLRKWDEKKEQRKREKKAAEQKTKQAIRDKKERDAAFAKEQKAITAQIKKYHEMSMAGALGKKLKKAKLAYTAAVAAEKKHAGHPSVKEFRKKYRLDTPAEKEPDYPKSAANSTAPAAKAPAAKAPAAKAAAAPAPAPTLKESNDESEVDVDEVSNSVADAMAEADAWPSD